VNITLTLDPEVEKELLARAQERGLTLDAYLEALAATQRNGKEKAEVFIAWVKGHRTTTPLSDEPSAHRPSIQIANKWRSSLIRTFCFVPCSLSTR
jgi:hypothetical protein